MVGLLACRSSALIYCTQDRCTQRRAERHHGTLTPPGAQAGEMPTDGELLKAANRGELKEVRDLIAAGANMEEEDSVSDGAGTSVVACFVALYLV